MGTIFGGQKNPTKYPSASSNCVAKKNHQQTSGAGNSTCFEYIIKNPRRRGELPIHEPVGLVIPDHIWEFDDLCVVTVNLPPRFGSETWRIWEKHCRSALVVSTHFKNSSYFIQLDQLKKSVSPQFWQGENDPANLWEQPQSIENPRIAFKKINIDSPHQNTKNIRCFGM